MKLYEFDEKRFNVYAIIYANNEAEAIRYYLNNIYGTEVSYNVPKALDMDDFWEICTEKYTDLDKYEVRAKFSACCVNTFSQKDVKRVM